jgi:hypothetical protein
VFRQQAVGYAKTIQTDRGDMMAVELRVSFVQTLQCEKDADSIFVECSLEEENRQLEKLHY